MRGRGGGVRDDLRPGGAARGEFRQALLVERRDRGLVPDAELLIPAAPCGAEDAKTSLRMIAGRISAISCATKLPIENPRMSAWPNPRAVMNAMASRAI